MVLPLKLSVVLLFDLGEGNPVTSIHRQCKSQKTAKSWLYNLALCRRFSVHNVHMWSHVLRIFSCPCVCFFSVMFWLCLVSLDRFKTLDCNTVLSWSREQSILAILCFFWPKNSDGLMPLIDFPLQSSSASGLIARRVEEKWPLGSFTRQSVTRSLGVKTDEFGGYLFRKRCVILVNISSSAAHSHWNITDQISLSSFAVFLF